MSDKTAVKSNNLAQVCMDLQYSKNNMSLLIKFQFLSFSTSLHATKMGG